MPESMLWQLAAQLLMMALTGACGWLAGKLKGAAAERKKRAEESDEERDMFRASLRLLFFYRIRDIRNDAVKQGSLAATDKHQLDETFKVYSEDLGGNGAGAQMYKEAMALPTE